jgi:hypothetical protein
MCSCVFRLPRLNLPVSELTEAPYISSVVRNLIRSEDNSKLMSLVLVGLRTDWNSVRALLPPGEV